MFCVHVSAFCVRYPTFCVLHLVGTTKSCAFCDFICLLRSVNHVSASALLHSVFATLCSLFCACSTLLVESTSAFCDFYLRSRLRLITSLLASAGPSWAERTDINVGCASSLNISFIIP